MDDFDFKRLGAPLIKATTQFVKTEIEIGKKAAAYHSWVAIWSNRGRGHVLIGAPTLDDLADRWEQITNCDFSRTDAQEVYICSRKIATETGDAGEHESKVQ